jgi:AcrR family transcriptional regulator
MAAIAQTAPGARRLAVREFKKSAIRAAAREVLGREGVEGVTMRAVAAACGFAPGALYAYFPGREAILADLLAQSLATLAKSVRAACAAEGDATAALRAGANTMLAHYLDNADDLRLLASLGSRRPPPPGGEAALRVRLGAQSAPGGEAALRVRLGAPQVRDASGAPGGELDRQINGRLIASLVPLANAISDATSLPSEAANAKTVGLFIAIIGAALLAATSRLELLGFAPSQLVGQATDDLLRRTSS